MAHCKSLGAQPQAERLGGGFFSVLVEVPLLGFASSPLRGVALPVPRTGA